MLILIALFSDISSPFFSHFFLNSYTTFRIIINNQTNSTSFSVIVHLKRFDTRHKARSENS